MSSHRHLLAAHQTRDSKRRRTSPLFSMFETQGPSNSYQSPPLLLSRVVQSMHRTLAALHFHYVHLSYAGWSTRSAFLFASTCSRRGHWVTRDALSLMAHADAGEVFLFQQSLDASSETEEAILDHFQQKYYSRLIATDEASCASIRSFAGGQLLPLR